MLTNESVRSLLWIIQINVDKAADLRIASRTLNPLSRENFGLSPLVRRFLGLALFPLLRAHLYPYFGFWTQGESLFCENGS